MCSGAVLLTLVAVCQLSCNVSAHLQYTVNSLAGKAEANCQPASENIEQPGFVITLAGDTNWLIVDSSRWVATG